jgi:glutamine cyclotransferase
MKKPSRRPAGFDSKVKITSSKMVTLSISDSMYKFFGLNTRYSILDTRLISSIENRASRITLILLSFLLIIFGCSDKKTSETPESYTYRVVKTHPHDPNAFTQGLVFENGFLYEGTGIYGKSTLRRVDLDTGQILQIYKLPDKYFGEGMTIFKDKIYQLTYKSKIGFVYDKSSFKLLQRFNYPTLRPGSGQAEGWGITHDGKNLIMSDGSSTLYLWDPETLQRTGSIKVHDNGVPVSGLNELEYIKGQLFANVWPTERIAIISPQTGQVTGWIYMQGLLSQQARLPRVSNERKDSYGGWYGGQELNKPVDVLNGIAYDATGDRLFITGKFWPKLFEIKLAPIK